MKKFINEFWSLLLGGLFVLMGIPSLIVYVIESKKLEDIEIAKQIELFGYYDKNIRVSFIQNKFEFLSIIGITCLICACAFVCYWCFVYAFNNKEKLK